MCTGSVLFDWSFSGVTLGSLTLVSISSIVLFMSSSLNYDNSSNCNKLLKRGHDKTEVDDSAVVKKIKEEPIEISRCYPVHQG
jgi:hypothetical protein